MKRFFVTLFTLPLLAQGFFSMSALAQEEGPDFTITNATFTSERLIFTAINQGGESGNSGGTISYIWLGADDTQHGRIFMSNQYALKPSGGSMTIDTNLDESFGFMTTETIREFVFNPPQEATRLQVRVGKSKTLEIDDIDTSNNSVFLEKPSTYFSADGDQKPDLVVTNVNYNYDGLSYQIQNTGDLVMQGSNIPMLHNWQDGSGNNSQNSRQYITLDAVLNPGESITVNSIDHPGLHDLINPLEDLDGTKRSLRIWVDHSDFHEELNEENNLVVIGKPKPDLVIEALGVSDGYYYYELRNNGPGIAGDMGSAEMRVAAEWLDDEGNVLWTSGNLGSGPYRVGLVSRVDSRTHPIYLQRIDERPEGATIHRVIADSDNNFEEADEDNNIQETYFLTISDNDDLDTLDLEGLVEVESDNEEGASIISFSEESTDAMIQFEEKVDWKDLGVEEPKVLPGDGLYTFKKFGRILRSTITFDEQKQAELHKKYANEKILEIQALIKKEQAEKALSALDDYNKEVDRLNRAVKNFDPSKKDLQKTIETSVKDQFLHQAVLAKLEKKAALKSQLEAKKKRAESLRQINKLLDTVKSPELKSEMVDKAIRKLNQRKTPFTSLKSLEILKGLEENAISKQDYIANLKKKAAESFEKDFEQFGNKYKGLLPTYLKKTSSDNERLLKAIDDINKVDQSDEKKPKIPLQFLRDSLQEIKIKKGEKEEVDLEEKQRLENEQKAAEEAKRLEKEKAAEAKAEEEKKKAEAEKAAALKKKEELKKLEEEQKKKREEIKKEAPFHKGPSDHKPPTKEIIEKAPFHKGPSDL